MGVGGIQPVKALKTKIAVLPRKYMPQDCNMKTLCEFPAQLRFNAAASNLT
jgi:hypothetical protein